MVRLGLRSRLLSRCMPRRAALVKVEVEMCRRLVMECGVLLETNEFGAAAVKDCVRDVWFAATGILAWWLWRLVCKQLCRVSSYVFTSWFDWWLFVVEMVKAALIVVVGVPVNAMFSWK
ncbi:hypothetical protein Droror1_Dr00001222 [Drosera rotundifolia]